MIFQLHRGDCIEVMRTMADNSVDAVVCDPPYGLEFMGKEWDGADGFRRSLNAADAGRDNTFGRMSKKAPEYRAGRLFQEWCEAWAAEALRVLKPGGHLLAFSGSRTYHRMACGIEDAGFEVRDQALWLYGSGFPKSRDISKAIDKEAGAARKVVSEGKAVKRMIPGADQDKTGSWVKDNGREYVPQVTKAALPEAAQWAGWGTALKPSHEPICLARKPLERGLTVAANVLKWGTGALNIDGCRVAGLGSVKFFSEGDTPVIDKAPHDAGRWPANIIHDGSDEVVALFPAEAGQQAALKTRNSDKTRNTFGDFAGTKDANFQPHDTRGSAARFFYCAKASRTDRNEGLPSGDKPAVATDATMRECEDADWSARNGNHHPTVKPTELMAYLCRLVTPPGGTVLDPFFGSGSTGKACMREGFTFVGIDKDEGEDGKPAGYLEIARARIEHELTRGLL